MKKKEEKKSIQYTLLFDEEGVDLSFDTKNEEIDEMRFAAYAIVLADQNLIFTNLVESEAPKELKNKYANSLGILSLCADLLKKRIENKNGYGGSPQSQIKEILDFLDIRIADILKIEDKLRKSEGGISLDPENKDDKEDETFKL